MAHRRKLIRDTVVTVLQNHPAILALPVVPSIESGRHLPLDRDSLPKINVYFRREQSEDQLNQVSPRQYDLRSELVVEYCARSKHTAGAPGEDELDAAAEAIEPAMDVLETGRVGDLVFRMRYLGSEAVIAQEGAQKSLCLVMRYDLKHAREVFAVNLDDFLLAHVEQAIGEPAEYPTDDINLPQ